MNDLFHAVSSEWLKRRRSLTTPLVAGSATFVPAIMLAARLRHAENLPVLYASRTFWQDLFVQAWESMALMVLPLASMLIVSLVTQIEDRNHGWKQLQAAPLPLRTIFLAKLTVILALVGLLVFLHGLAILAVGLMPTLLLPELSAPTATFPFAAYCSRSATFLADVLPVVSLQYLLALRFRTFVAPLAIGMALWILSIGLISWQYSYILPYSYPALDYLLVEYQRPLVLPTDPSTVAIAACLVFTMAAAVSFSSRRDAAR